MVTPTTPTTKAPRRVRLAEGIYRDKYGLSARVHVRGVQREQRFPFGTSHRVMQRWRQVTAEAIRQAKPLAVSGTLAADIETYLKTLANRPQLQAERTTHLAWWRAKFGSRPRYTLERGELAAALAELEVTPYERYASKPLVTRSASTVRHYRTALFHLYTTLDGKNAPNPLKDVPPPRQPEPEPRALPYEVIEGVLNAMPDRGRPTRHMTRPKVSQTKARLRVMAYVGIPPAQIAKLTPAHVDWLGASVLVQGRKKGLGTKTVRLPVTDRGAAALRELFATRATGAFSASAVRASFRRGVKALCDTMAKTDPQRAGELRAILSTARPYDLRHSFLTSVYLVSKDIRAAQAFALHADSRMTERYTQAAVSARLRDVAALLNSGVHAAVPPNAAPGPTAGSAPTTETATGEAVAARTNADTSEQTRTADGAARGPSPARTGRVSQ